MPERRQFNVNLDAELVRRTKHEAIDRQLSLGDLVTHALTAFLSAGGPNPQTGTSMSTTPHGLTLQPMVHVEDMAASVAFYEALGAELLHGSRDGDFAMLRVGSGELTLLAHPPNPEQNEGTVELNFTTEDDLSLVEDRLRGAGVTIAAPASDEGFGAQLQVATPDGLLVKINRLEPELYT